MPAVAAGDPAATVIALTPSGRVSQYTPSSTSDHREYMAMFAIPRPISTRTTTAASTGRAHVSRGLSGEDVTVDSTIGQGAAEVRCRPSRQQSSFPWIMGETIT